MTEYTCLERLCAQYLSVREYELDEATKAGARLACRSYDHMPDHASLLRLDKASGNRFKNWLVASGRSMTTANIYLRAIHPVLSFGVDAGLWAAHPWDGVKQFDVPERPVTIYEDEQFERMLYFLPRPTADDPQRDLRWLAILWGARTTGLRRGELLNLTWDNLRGGLVWVEPKKATDKTWPWQIEPLSRSIRGLGRSLAPPFLWIQGPVPTGIKILILAVNGQTARRWLGLAHA